MAPTRRCLSRLANTLLFLGGPEETRRARDAAFALGEEIDHPEQSRDRARLRRGDDLYADRGRQAKPNQLAAEMFASLIEVLDGRAGSGLVRIRAVQDAATHGGYAPAMAGIGARVLLESTAATGEAARYWRPPTNCWPWAAVRRSGRRRHSVVGRVAGRVG